MPACLQLAAVLVALTLPRLEDCLVPAPPAHAGAAAAAGAGAQAPLADRDRVAAAPDERRSLLAPDNGKAGSRPINA